MTEEEFQKEIERRIALVEKGETGFKQMQKKDYIQVIVFVGICLLGIIAGAFL